MNKPNLLLFSILLAAASSFSQVEDRFNYINENEIKEFGKPLVTSLGVAMNTGSFHSAYVPSTFGFAIGVRGMFIFIPESQKTFTPHPPAGYTSITGKNESATFYGNEGAIYSGPGGFITYPNGVDQSSVPFIIPQASISLLGTEALVRWAPVKIKDTKITLFGVGLKHSISRYFPYLPVSIALQVMYNKFDIENVATSKHWAFSGIVSKSYPLWTIYGALQYETSKVNFDYTIKGDPLSGDPLLQTSRSVTADVDGDNKMRLTAGAALTLGVLVLNADFSLGSQSVASAGFTFEF